MILVVGKDLASYRDFLVDTIGDPGLGQRCYRFVTSPHMMKGTARYMPVVLLPGYMNHPEWEKIRQLIKDRSFMIVRSEHLHHCY